MLEHLLSTKSIVNQAFEATLEKMIEKERMFRRAIKKLGKASRFRINPNRE